MEINKRIVVLMDYFGYNKSTFAEFVDVSQPIITHITNGRNKPGMDIIQKLLIKIPDLNPNWLLIGEGDMFLKQEEKKKKIKYLISAINSDLLEVKDKVKTLENNLQQLSALME